MDQKKAYQFGSTCAFLTAVGYFAIGLTYLLLPAAFKTGTPEEYWTAVSNNYAFLRFNFWLFVFTALVAIGVVITVTGILEKYARDFVRWSGVLAIFAFAVQAMEYLGLQAMQPWRADWYFFLEKAQRDMFVATSGQTFDPNGYLGFGLIGLWVFLVSGLAWRHAVLPKWLSGLGFAVGVAYWLVVIANIFALPLLTAIAAGLGGVILAPIWYGGLGVVLRRAPAAVRKSAGEARPIDARPQLE